jgi:hypothetical protein
MSLSFFSDLGSNQPKPLAKFEPDSGRAPSRHIEAISGIFRDVNPIVAFK